MDGREFAQNLLATAPHLKVIYTSGYSSEMHLRDLKLGPGVSFLSKPFDMLTLAQLIRDSLAGK